MLGHEGDVGPEHGPQRFLRLRSAVGGRSQPAEQLAPDPPHGGQPERVLGGEVLEQGALGEADGAGDVGGRDERRAGVAGKCERRADDVGLALFGGQSCVHRPGSLL
jgi:hypothetical protein